MTAENEDDLSADDRILIAELVIRADNAASSRDVDAYLALFTDDAAISGDMGDHPGKTALRTSLPEIWAAEGTRKRHLTSNIEIAGTSDQATTDSVLLIVEVVSQPTIVTTASVHHEVRRVAGRWLIAARRITLDPGSVPIDESTRAGRTGQRS